MTSATAHQRDREPRQAAEAAKHAFKPRLNPAISSHHDSLHLRLKRGREIDDMEARERGYSLFSTTMRRLSSSILTVTSSPVSNGKRSSPATSAGMVTYRVLARSDNWITLPFPSFDMVSILVSKVFILTGILSIVVSITLTKEEEPMQKKFTPMGKIQKVRDALAVQVDGWKLGQLVIAAGDIPKLLNGRVVDVHFVQQRDGREPFIGYAGTAVLSRSGRAVNVKIEGRFMTAPVAAVRKVIAGQQIAARLSAPAPIIDAEKQQREAIDVGLVRGF